MVVGVGSGECWGEGYRSVIHGACVSTSSQITRSILPPLTTLTTLQSSFGKWSSARDKSRPKGMEGNYAGCGRIEHGVDWGDGGSD